MCCSHSVALSADRWPDNMRLSDIEPRFVYAAAWTTAFVSQRSVEAMAWSRASLPGTVHQVLGNDTVDGKKVPVRFVVQRLSRGTPSTCVAKAGGMKLGNGVLRLMTFVAAMPCTAS